MKTAILVGIAFIVFAIIIILTSLKKAKNKATGKGTESGAGNSEETEIQKHNNQ